MIMYDAGFRKPLLKVYLSVVCINASWLSLNYIILYPINSVWQKLEEENADFFRAYYIRLKLKKQILLFNHLLEHQYHLMKYPMPPKVSLAPRQNGIHPMPGTVVPFLQNAYSYLYFPFCQFLYPQFFT